MKLRRKSELFLEESVLDDMASSMDCVEMPLARGAFTLVIAVAAIMSLIVFGRVFLLGVNAGTFYRDRAIANVSDITVRPAERGIFFDRTGMPLVRNVPTFRVVLYLSNFFKKDPGVQEHELGELTRIVGIDKEGMRAWLSSVDLERQSSIVIARDLTVEQVAEIKNLAMDDVNIENDFKRQYEEPGMFSHLMGYVGVVADKDVQSDKNLLLNDLIGKSGLELYYDNELRGKNGATIDYRNAKNESLGRKTEVAPERGNNAYLTIDGGLQTYVYGRLKAQLERMGKIAGAGIAMDPKTGEVLAMVSLPTFDNNHITSEDLTSVHRPLFNRAIAGVYNPASTIKPLVATAALSENVIDPNRKILANGYIEIPNPYTPSEPSRFNDWKVHGWIDLHDAIARSSNVFFYTVGGGYQDIKGLGVDRLAEYWRKFRLDQKTGIDLPGEKVGFLPNPAEKEKRTGTPWRIGDTYHVSIGQGDLMITPLELIDYIASIAADGKMFRPFLVKKIVDEKGNTIREMRSEMIADNSNLLPALREVQRGMRDGSQKPYGTSYLLHDLPFVTASKTGSAQIQGNTKLNAFYVGYAPAEDPKITLLILIEDAQDGGGNAVPVAHDVLKWYYENRLKK